MPRGDSTGPVGMGHMTGRGAGFCTGYNMPGYLNRAGGRGCGMGFGRRNNFGGVGVQGGGFGRRNRFLAWAEPDPEREKQALKSAVEYMQTKMEALKKRLEELTAKE